MSTLLATVVRIHTGICSRLQNLCFKALGTRINGYAWMRRVKIPRQWADITIENGASLDENVTLLCSDAPRTNKIHIGESVYINRYTMIDASESIQIGRDTMIGPSCYITDHDHSYSAGEKPSSGTLLNAPTNIGERVWLGAKVCVLKGVTIGDNAVIGAGSIVTRDIPANSLALGVPAKVVRQLDQSNPTKPV